MTLPRKLSFVVRAATRVAFVLTAAHTAFTQPPPPPSGVVLQIPDKPDSAARIPQFDIISVKPGKDNRTQVQFTPTGMRGASVTIQFLLFEGFGGINQKQVIGEPSWSTTDGFDIEAKVAEEDLPRLAKLTFEQRRTMFQQILADRFKLVAHHETRVLPIYQLVVGRDGSKLKETEPGDSTTPRPKGMMFGLGKVTSTGGTVSMLIPPLSRQLGLIIVDKTGLTGKYDFTLEWAPEGLEPPSGAAGSDQPGPDIFTAIQEQLGLKLESTKGPVDVIVIDHIEKPSAN